MPKDFASFAKKFSKLLDHKSDYWLEKVPAWLGNTTGTVQVPGQNGMVYARLVNGQVIKVLNTTAPNIYNYAVFVGRDKMEPQIWKVAGVRWIYNLPETLAYILFHHGQHEYPAPDTVWVRRDQFMPLLVMPAGGFTFNLYGDVVYRIGMDNPIRVENQEAVDLSAYVITAGAKYVLLEIEQDGTLNYIEGAVVDSVDLLAEEPIPTPTANAFPVCVFRFFGDQTSLRKDDVQRDIIDLRQFTTDGGASLVTWGEIIGDITNQTDLQTVLDTKFDDNNFPTIVMEDGVTFPPVPITTEDGDDWIYSN